MSRAKAKGTSWETALVRYLRENGVPHAERRALAGTLDRGDIAGVPGVVIEAKSASRIDLAGWTAEAETERVNDGAAYGIVWAKRAGKTSPADGYVVMTGAALVQLLTEAGYIAAPASLPELRKRAASADDELLEALRDLVCRHDQPPPVQLDDAAAARQHLAGLAGGDRCPDHPGQPADNCALCRSEELGGDT